MSANTGCAVPALAQPPIACNGFPCHAPTAACRCGPRWTSFGDFVGLVTPSTANISASDEALGVQPESCSLNVDAVVALYTVAAFASSVQCCFGVVVLARKLRSAWAHPTKAPPRLVIGATFLAVVKGAIFFVTCAVRAAHPTTIAFGAPGALAYSVAVRVALFLEFCVFDLFFLAASRIIGNMSVIIKSGAWSTRAARMWELLAAPYASLAAVACFAPIALIEAGYGQALAAKVHFAVLVVFTAITAIGMLPFLGVIQQLRVAEHGAVAQSSSGSGAALHTMLS